MLKQTVLLLLLTLLSGNAWATNFCEDANNELCLLLNETSEGTCSDGRDACDLSVNANIALLKKNESNGCISCKYIL